MSSDSATMRAVLIKDDKGPVENLYIGEAPKPVPKRDEVLVKIKAFGLNRMDVIQREGHYPPPAGSSSILGVEFSGTITAIGDGVSSWKIGDEVFGLAGGGAYAEYIAVLSTHILTKPKHLSWTEAASIPENFLTAFQALIVIGEVKAGEDVLVHAGASGVGIAAIQLARVYGAKVVTATASSEAKLDWLRSIPNGATHTANYKLENPSWPSEVKKFTNNKGVNVIIDFVGQTHFQGNIDSLALDGRMIMLGLLSGGQVPAGFNLGALLYKRLRIQGSTLRSRTESYQADLIARFNSEALTKIGGAKSDSPLKTYIHKVYKWTEIQDAHREMQADKNIGKIIVEVV